MDRLLPARALGRDVVRAWRWPQPEWRDAEWWPQGVAVSPVGDRLAVSWYSKAGAGSRITLVDLETMEFRHQVLAAPDGGLLRIHAGGVAWLGEQLAVAATRSGLWMLDAGSLTVSGLWRAPTDLDFRFSFVSETRDGAGVWAGEYGSQTGQSTRVGRFGLSDGVLTPITVTDTGLRRMQGVAELPDGRLAVSISNGPRLPGTLAHGGPGDWRRRLVALPVGPEDLSFDVARVCLWGVTEHPGRRWLVQLRVPGRRGRSAS